MPSSPSLQAWAKHDVARFVDVLVKHQPVALWRAHAPCAIIMEHSGGALLSDRCGLFATLGECFCPTTLLGDFPVRMSQYEYVGGVRMGVETILLIVSLAFAAGFVLDRLAIRQSPSMLRNRRMNSQ
jgi:hypothetical protein